MGSTQSTWESSLISHISWKFQLCLLICSSAQVKMKFVVCVAVLVAVVSASYPPHPPPYYGPVHRRGFGGVGGHGGGLDPVILLLLQKNGGLGGKGGGGINSLLPLLLAGGLGGKKGGFDPLLLALLGSGKCLEQYPGGCIQPATANTDGNKLCGIKAGNFCERVNGGGGEKCWPCCSCPHTPDATGYPSPPWPH